MLPRPLFSLLCHNLPRPLILATLSLSCWHGLSLTRSHALLTRSAATMGSRQYRVFIAGSSYGGLAAACDLVTKCDSIESPIDVQVTIVDERDGFYHLIGSPLAFASKEYAKKAWVEFRDIKALQRPNVEFVHGRVKSVDTEAKAATVLESSSSSSSSSSSNNDGTTRTFSYDFFIGATGLRRAFPVVPQALTREAYLAETGEHIDRVTNSTAPVLVVGGGAVGIEMAAELKHVQPGVKVTLAHSRDRLLSAEPLPDSVANCAHDLTAETGVDVLLGHRLASSEPAKDPATGADVREVTFDNGHRMLASEVVMAISRSAPSTDFMPAAALSEEGLVNVEASLQLKASSGEGGKGRVVVPNAESHFAVGDMINWSGIKRCGGAMHMGKYAADNVHQLMLRDLHGRQPQLNTLNEIPPMIGLAVGGNAVSYYGPDGVKHGPDIMKLFFEDDLGFRIVWDYLKLGGAKEAAAKA